jgi:hypothetical protein
MAETKTHNFTHPISGFTLKFPWNDGQKPPVEIVNDAFAKMDFNGELVFDDLTKNYSFSERYSNDLRQHYDDIETPVEDLQEKDFEYWNQIEYNLTRGGNFALKDMSQLPLAERQKIWRRFNAYDRTKARGEGSRDLIEQVKGVAASFGTDLTNLAGGGIAKNVVQQTAGKGALRWMVRNVLFPGTAGATWASLSDAERQIIDRNLVDEPFKEDFDYSRLGMNAALGFVTGPAAKPLVLGTSKIFQFVKSPIKAGKEGYESILDILGASTVAKKGVVDEAQAEFGFSQPSYIGRIKKSLEDIAKGNKDNTPSGADAARAANISLKKELEEVDEVFKTRYRDIGELDISARNVQDLYNNLIKNVPKDQLANLTFLMTRLKRTPKNIAIKGDQLTPTQVIRRMRRIIGDATYNPNNANIKEVLEFHNDIVRKEFAKWAKKAGKGDEVKALDDEFSQYAQLSGAIKNAAEEESKAQNLIYNLVNNPAKSSILIDNYFEDIKKIALHSGNKDLVENHRELLRNTLNEKLFESDGFLRYFKTESGRQTLQKLYPGANDINMNRWANILENAEGRGSASVFWGRMIATSIGATGVGLATGPTGALIGFSVLNSFLSSPVFQTLVMNAYSKSGINEKAMGKIEKMLRNKKVPEEQIPIVLRAIRGDIPAAQLTKQSVSNMPEDTPQAIEDMIGFGLPLTERTSD